jgi:large repetitive protein
VLTSPITTSTPGSNCPPAGTDPRCSASVTVLTPGLTITKTANATAVVPGQPVGYTITVTDSGQTPYSGATVTDSLSGVLGDAVYNGDATATAGAVSYAGPVLTWTGDLAAGATATITYSVTVNNPDTGGKVMTNTAVSAAAGSTCPAGGQNAACTATVTVLTPGLTIAKTANAATATPGGTVAYTITVTDSGQTPYTGASFTDPLTGVLDDAAYNADASATAGTVSYTSPTLTWTGNLAVGAVATITYSVTVDNPDTGGGILANTVTSATAGGNCAPGSTDARCSVTVTVAQLLIVNQANVATTTPGGVIRFTSTYTNTGQVPYTGITIVLGGSASLFAYAAPDGDQTATSGTLTVGPTGLLWTGNIPVGGTVTVTGTFTVDNPVPLNTVLTSPITTSTPGSNCPPAGTDPRCSASVTVLTPGLAITKTADVSTTTPGATVGYTITVADTGQTAYTGATVIDDLTGVLTDAGYNGDGTATTGTVSYTSPVLTWTGNLTAGATATITYSVTVSNPDTGDKLLVNAVTSAAVGSNCPVSGTAAACTTSVQDLIPALTITKTAGTGTASPGGAVHYTITVADTGQTPYTGASVTDNLTGVLDDASYNSDAAATAGSVSYASPVLTWTGDLAVGGSVTITYSATVDDPETGDKIMANTVTSAATGSNCPSGTINPACSATVAVLTGVLSISVPAGIDLGAIVTGGTAAAGLGNVTVTDNRALAGGSWTATVSSSNFLNTVTSGDLIQAGNASYLINALVTTTGSATFTPTPVTVLSGSPQAVVTATGANGDNSATWDPQIQVSIPSTAVIGIYAAIITQSAS